mgnify:CR=1 FL=1
MSKAPMRGLFPILVTPFDAQDRIDEESLRRLVEYNIEGGVHGFGLAGATEFAKLTEAERLRVTRIVVAQAARRVPVIATTGAASTYVRKHLTNLKISAFLEVFAVLGALAGAAFTITSGLRLLFFLCGMILFGSSVLLWKHREQPWSASSHPDRVARQIELDGSYYDAVERRTIACGDR